MPKTPTVVFKTRAPHIIDAYEAQVQERWDAYRAKITELQQEWGTEQLTQIQNYDGTWITGYVAENYNDAPMPGFRRDSKTGYMLPAKRTAEGKAIVERIKNVSFIPGAKPGLPKLVWGEGYMGQFLIEKLDGVWYAYCTVPLRSDTDSRGKRMDGLDEVDVQLWEPVKLSEYFLAREAEDAKKEQEKADA